VRKCACYAKPRPSPLALGRGRFAPESSWGARVSSLPMKSLLQLGWRAFKTLCTWLLGLLILFEEWGWVPLARMLGAFSRLPVIAWLERRISALPPGLALLVFLVPALLLIPVKVGALWLMGRGRALLGLALIVVAKIVGTAIVARLFMLTQPQLMRMPWFARLYSRWVAWKEVVMARVRASVPWRTARVFRRRWRVLWRRG